MTAATPRHNPNANGPKPTSVSLGRVGLYAFIIVTALFFLMPLIVMLITSLKTMEQIRQGSIFELPWSLNFDAWVKAWGSACTGLNCTGVKVGFVNSFKILIPSTILSIALAAWTGYMLSFWRARGSTVIFAILLVGAFIPFQVFIYPLVRVFSTVGLFGTLPGIILIHTAFGLPVLSLLFRNFFTSLPIDLFKAARVDGAGIWQIFRHIMLPMATPMVVVAVILQVTGIWNDFILGVVFAGPANMPMTVQLNNIVNATQGVKEYNVNMAATMITAIVPLAVYFLSGRWFVRGIAAGAVKG
ncbi:carbohydrate ABC transporter permease [Tabrizicola sp.]|jgi:glucose/mannose transport system permease protein|uniref:carbohydrate ABC transporter permease n=1 Tax=Tabrizicola sp. TaxID=2005166 RepID=UPI001A4F7565|nr:carbohydrate ABC transporter permease [Tabrizicola sp.]MBL9063062.1 carbohydrate ABC transporter permease [Tabrizicola sp.]